jgi:3-hydroxy-9,10-secoandrosta-1,3,5(10)-triene-9,17-dione monooxygenase reductase component
VSFCVAHTSTTWPRLRAAGHYAVSILAEHQRDACLRLATRGGDKFRGLAWTPSPAGHPVLDGALGWLDCELKAEHWAGDHLIALCRVLSLDIRAEGRPLIFYRGGYGGFSQVSAT